MDPTQTLQGWMQIGAWFVATGGILKIVYDTGQMKGLAESWKEVAERVEKTADRFDAKASEFEERMDDQSGEIAEWKLTVTRAEKGVAELRGYVREGFADIKKSLGELRTSSKDKCRECLLNALDEMNSRLNGVVKIENRGRKARS